MYQQGDIIEIPLPDGRIAIGWILHISQHFKDAVGFIVFGLKGTVSDDVIYQDQSNIPLSMKVLGPLYTHFDNLKLCKCIVIANLPISESKRQWTRREVGGNVYIGDDCLGSVDELGESNLKPMLSMGMPVVYSEIVKAFGTT